MWESPRHLLHLLTDLTDRLLIVSSGSAAASRSATSSISSTLDFGLFEKPQHNAGAPHLPSHLEAWKPQSETSLRQSYIIKIALLFDDGTTVRCC